jgi:hypothetical protein
MSAGLLKRNSRYTTPLFQQTILLAGGLLHYYCEYIQRNNISFIMDIAMTSQPLHAVNFKHPNTTMINHPHQPSDSTIPWLHHFLIKKQSAAPSHATSTPNPPATQRVTVRWLSRLSMAHLRHGRHAAQLFATTRPPTTFQTFPSISYLMLIPRASRHEV